MKWGVGGLTCQMIVISLALLWYMVSRHDKLILCGVNTCIYIHNPYQWTLIMRVSIIFSYVTCFYILSDKCVPLEITIIVLHCA